MLGHPGHARLIAVREPTQDARLVLNERLGGGDPDKLETKRGRLST